MREKCSKGEGPCKLGREQRGGSEKERKGNRMRQNTTPRLEAGSCWNEGSIKAKIYHMMCPIPLPNIYPVLIIKYIGVTRVLPYLLGTRLCSEGSE